MLGAAPDEAAKRGAELAARVIQQQGAIVNAP